MNLSLEDITADNYEAICELDVTKTQEEYVACNMWSLVEAHYNSGYTCKAIYLNESPRVCQRLNNLRNWNYEKIKSLYIRIS